MRAFIRFFSSVKPGLFLFLSIVCMGSVICRADEEPKPLAISDTPAAVQKAITNQVAGGKLVEIDRYDRNGETVFHCSLTATNGDDRDFDVADDGTLLSVEVGLSEVPDAVQKTIKSLADGWELGGVDKNLDEPEISFDVEVTKDDKSKSFCVGEDGRILSMEIGLEDAPEVVQKAIKARLGDAKLGTLTKYFDADVITYDVDAASGNLSENSFSVSAEGTILSEQVSLEKVPPPARSTIREKIGDGKILRIDKSLFEKKDGVLPYEVQGRKVGKPFDFSVGPRGRFLGMDQ